MTNKKYQFNTLTQFFLESLNPRPEKYVVMLDAVLSVPDDAIEDETALRYQAHDAVQTLLRPELYARQGVTPLRTHLLEFAAENGLSE